MSAADGAKRLVFRAFGTLPKPFRRLLIRTLQPSWTAGSVAVIERPDGRWLFVKPVYRDGWTLPGGLVDRGESPAATVVREMAEEIGATVEVTGPGLVALDPQYRRLETVFRVSLTSGQSADDLQVTTAELSGLQWRDPHSPPELERETAEVLALVLGAVEGGPTLRILGDDSS